MRHKRCASGLTQLRTVSWNRQLNPLKGTVSERGHSNDFDRELQTEGVLSNLNRLTGKWTSTKYFEGGSSESNGARFTMRWVKHFSWIQLDTKISNTTIIPGQQPTTNTHTVVQWLDCWACMYKVEGSNPTNLTADYTMTRISIVFIVTDWITIYRFAQFIIMFVWERLAFASMVRLLDLQSQGCGFDSYQTNGWFHK